MANQWYLQHNGKLYGPLASGELKRLAAAGKIKPTTQVRLGADGQWGPASRVQGLFAAAAHDSAPTNSQATPPVAPVVTPSDLRREANARLAAANSASSSSVPPIPPPVAAPLAAQPMQASPLARAPLLAARPAEPVAAPLGAKITGAVGMILGVLAMSTFWLPMLGSPLGWIGIGVGAVGLLVGIAGLIVSARQQASGLYLNVAAASSSVVGLVLSIVLAITFGMFKSAPAPLPNIVQAPIPIPVQEPPAPPASEPEPAPEPEPEPEPPKIVWTSAEQAIEAPPIRARVANVAIEKMRLESTDLTSMKPSKPAPLLKVRVTIVNTAKDKILEVPGWVGGAGLLGGQADAALGALLENSELGKNDLGKQLKSATAGATLVDQAGNAYPQVPAIRIFNGKPLGQDPKLKPGESSDKELIFEPPAESIEYLHLELSPGGYGGAEPLRFEIPASMVNR